MSRERRGRDLAKSVRPLLESRGLWRCASGSGGRAYLVDVSKATPACTCPDFQKRQEPCKHVFAVQIHLGQRTAEPRPSYTQDWPAYNAAQTQEKDCVVRLLHVLCREIAQPDQQRGRTRLPLGDMVFASAMKVYLTRSGRRTTPDLRELADQGWIRRAPHYNTVSRYLSDPDLTPLLTSLVEKTAIPLRGVETNFAVDSSGFSTAVYERWYDLKHGAMQSKARWVKAHIMVGVQTNVITAIQVTDMEGKGAGDSPHLLPLARRTLESFNVKELSADKAYSGHENVDKLVRMGVTPYIPFKENASANGPVFWAHMLRFFHEQEEEFLQRYHKRSNVETTFQMMKTKFGSSVRSRSFQGQINEVILKALCHNLCCLTSAMFELGLEVSLEHPDAEAKLMPPVSADVERAVPCFRRRRAS